MKISNYSNYSNYSKQIPIPNDQITKILEDVRLVRRWVLDIGYYLGQLE